MDHISKECQITPQDTVFELGSGRGRACFWLNTFIGCKVVGIEYIPEFVKRANTIKTRFEIEDVEFRQQDMLNTDYSNATVVYLYGTNLEDSAIQKLVEKFQALASGTKIITISYSLNEYTSQPIFEVMKHFTAPFPWGMADVYLQIKK
jgi:tRNA A58 N-methylase Trm61